MQRGSVVSAPVVGHVRRVGWTRISRGVHLPDQAADSLVSRAGAWAMVLSESAVITHLSAAALRGWWLPRGSQGGEGRAYVRPCALADHRSESAGESLLRVLHVVCDVPVDPQMVIQDDDGYVVARADLRIVGTRRLPEYDGAYHRDAVQYERDRARDRRLRTLGWDPDSYSAISVSRTPSVILRDADCALGRAHDPDRLDGWRQLWTESSYSAAGKLRLRLALGLPE